MDLGYQQVSGKRIKIFISGATDGLGRALSKRLLEFPCYELLLHGRNEKKISILKSELNILDPECRTKYYSADFSSLAEVRVMASTVLSENDSLHILINNAGVGLEPERINSVDGNELVFQVNYLSSYLLSSLLAPLLQNSQQTKIINVASRTQLPINFDDLMLNEGWSSLRAYAQSKTALVMMALSASKHLRLKGISIDAIHPGTLLPTKMVLGKFAPQDSLEQGVENIMKLILDLQHSSNSGRYFNGPLENKAIDQAYDRVSQAKLIEYSDICSGLVNLIMLPAENVESKRTTRI